MSLYEILPGLPPYGPEALPFSATGRGTHSEGFVIRFLPYTDISWVGNFQKGWHNYCDVIPHPNGEQFIVIAGGQGYVVTPADPTKWTGLSSSITFARAIMDLDAVLIGNDLWFELLGKDSLIWQTPRISWDEMRELKIKGLTLTGLASDLGDAWVEFAVDLVEGTVTGGSYNGPDSRLS